MTEIAATIIYMIIGFRVFVVAQRQDGRCGSPDSFDGMVHALMGAIWPLVILISGATAMLFDEALPGFKKAEAIHDHVGSSGERGK